MLLNIPNVLSADDLRRVRTAVEKVEFIDGRATAGWHAKLVKRNEQARAGDPLLEETRKLVADRLRANELFRLAVRPKALTPLLLSRYTPGMAYGSHVDDAMMGGVRTDVSFTLFLSDPETYDGGELVIETPSGEQKVRLPAGSLVTYPSTTLHRVAEVTRGARFAAVGWARSLVRDQHRRELLFDLDSARLALFRREGKTGEFDQMSKCSANLMRMWAED